MTALPCSYVLSVSECDKYIFYFYPAKCTNKACPLCLIVADAVELIKRLYHQQNFHMRSALAPILLHCYWFDFFIKYVSIFITRGQNLCHCCGQWWRKLLEEFLRDAQAWFYRSLIVSSSLRETAKNSVHTSTYSLNIRTHIQLIMRGECRSQPHL